MSDTGTLSATEVRALADRLHHEADTLRIRSDRQLRIYIIVDVLLLAYFAWAIHRIALLVDPRFLADTTGEIAVHQANNLVDQIKKAGLARAPELVREAERAVIRSVPDFRLQLERKLHRDLAQMVTDALDDSDRTMVAEMSRLGDAPALVVSAQHDPAAAAKLYAETEERVIRSPAFKETSSGAMTDLEGLRDDLRRLRDNRGLSPSEAAERRLLQVVLLKVKLPPDDTVTAIAPGSPSGARRR